MKQIFIIVILGLISACAATSQNAVIEIYPSVIASTIGNGTAISITVDDGRTSGVLGNLGEGKTIMTSQDLSQTIGLALVESFKTKGFNVLSTNDQNVVQIMVTIEELIYEKGGNAIKTDVKTKSRARLEVKDKSFIRTYSNSENRTIPFSANADSNNSQLSSTLTALVEKIAGDNELLSAIIR